MTGNFCNFVADRAALSIVQLTTCAPGTFTATNPPTPTIAAIDGTRLPRQPKFKGTTSIRYDADWGEYRVYLQGAALYQTGATQDLNVANNNKLVCPTAAASTVACSLPGFVSFDFSGGHQERQMEHRPVHPERVRQARPADDQHLLLDRLLRGLVTDVPD